MPGGLVGSGPEAGAIHESYGQWSLYIRQLKGYTPLNTLGYPDGLSTLRPGETLTNIQIQEHIVTFKCLSTSADGVFGTVVVNNRSTYWLLHTTVVHTRRAVAETTTCV